MKQKIHNFIEALFKRNGIEVLFRRRGKPSDPKSATAVKSKYGFWYVGNIFDRKDTSYGILQNGSVEENESRVFNALLGGIKKAAAFDSHPAIAGIAPLVMYDLGAHTGYYCMLAAAYARSHGFAIDIHAFEPIPEYIKQINANIDINKFDSKIAIHEYAASDRTGSSTFYLAGSGSSLNANFQPQASKSSITVQTVILDSYQEMNRSSLPRPNIIKIDIESHELNALKGMEKIIRSSQPILFIEIIKSMGDFINPHFAETFKYIESLGYECFETDELPSKPDEPSIKLARITDIDAIDGSRIEMYTFVPRTKAGLLNDITI